MSKIEQLVAAAKVLTGVHEVGENRGEMVTLMLKKTGLPGGYPWCAAYVSWVGYWAFYDENTKKSAWPLPITAGCAPIGAAAKQEGVLVDTAERGDLFLVYFPKLKRFGHVGIVLGKNADGSYDCIEGNTNDGGSREGIGVFIRTRRFDTAKGDRFVRWVDLM